MKAEGHRQAAEKIEKGIIKLQPETDPEIARMAIADLQNIRLWATE